MTLNRSISTKSAVTTIDAAFGLWPLTRSWRTFPGARLHGWGSGPRGPPDNDDDRQPPPQLQGYVRKVRRHGANPALL